MYRSANFRAHRFCATNVNFKACATIQLFQTTVCAHVALDNDCFNYAHKKKRKVKVLCR